LAIKVELSRSGDKQEAGTAEKYRMSVTNWIKGIDRSIIRKEPHYPSEL